MILKSLKRLYFFPQKHLMLSIPVVLVISFVTGTVFDMGFLKNTIIIATVIMIYATVIGLNIKEIFSLSHKKLIGFSLLINFLLIPLSAYILGMTFLKEQPMIFTGLALAALLPTSGMTISWTGIAKGNVSGAIKLTVLGLIAGSLLTPWYLLLMVGEYIEIDIGMIFKSIVIIVFLPLLLGQITTKWLRKKYSMEEFKTKIKPNFQPLSIWGMLYVVFASVSMRSEVIMENIHLIFISLITLIAFYFINFALSTLIAKKFFNRQDGFALVYGTALRNLSIAIGLAATAFGTEAALIVTFAFIVQQQGVVLYTKLAQSRWFALQTQ